MSASITASARASTEWLSPLPDGPLTDRFSALPTYSRVRSAFCVAASLEQSCSRQDS
jgi:hypothetical protein